MANWGSVQAAASAEQLTAIVEQAARALSGSAAGGPAQPPRAGRPGRAGGAGGAARLQRGDHLGDAAAEPGRAGHGQGRRPGLPRRPVATQLGRVHRSGPQRRWPRVGPTQKQRRPIRRSRAAAEQGGSLAGRRGVAGPRRPGLFGIHADCGREDPARPHARLRRRAGQSAPSVHCAWRRLPDAGRAPVRAGAGAAEPGGALAGVCGHAADWDAARRAGAYDAGRACMSPIRSSTRCSMRSPTACG